MKIKYIAFDGTVFDREDDCLLHEKETPLFIMYDDFGEITDDIEMAVLVEIRESKGVLAFCAYVDNKSKCEKVVSPGVYYWNTIQSEYLYIPDYILKTIKKVC